MRGIILLRSWKSKQIEKRRKAMCGTGGVIRLVTRWFARELRDSRKRWRKGLREGRIWLALPITVASMYVLWHWSFGLGFLFGLSFLTAAVLAILRGHIFTHPLRMVLVAIAVVIGSLVIPSLGGDAWNALRGGDTITAACLVGFVILFWLFKRQLETRRMRGVKVAAPRRQRKSRRR